MAWELHGSRGPLLLNRWSGPGICEPLTVLGWAPVALGGIVQFPKPLALVAAATFLLSVGLLQADCDTSRRALLPVTVDPLQSFTVRSPSAGQRLLLPVAMAV